MTDKEAFKEAMLAFGNNRGYWCIHCEGHVVKGHYEKCKLIKKAISLLGEDWVMKHIQVQEWGNYLTEDWNKD